MTDQLSPLSGEDTLLRVEIHLQVSLFRNIVLVKLHLVLLECQLCSPCRVRGNDCLVLTLVSPLKLVSQSPACKHISEAKEHAQLSTHQLEL